MMDILEGRKNQVIEKGNSEEGVYRLRQGKSCRICQPASMCILRLKGCALPDSRRPAPDPWPYRMRGIYLGYKGLFIKRPGTHRMSFFH